MSVGAGNLVTKVASLLLMLSCIAAIKWDYADPIEKLVGVIPPTIYEASSPSNRTYTEEEIKDCEIQFGKWKDGRWQHPPYDEYNLTEIVTNLGGYPGQVNATRNMGVPDAIFIDTNLTERPLPDSPRKNWVYEFNATDYASYVRLEHASKRFSGTPQEFLDIRGTLAWTPPDFCGQMRLVFYRLDDTGLHFEIRPAALEFQNNGTALAYRQPTICLIGINGKETCLS